MKLGAVRGGNAIVGDLLPGRTCLRPRSPLNVGQCVG